MIPEELHLRNFLSHRETDIELRGVHLASLVGDNGAGKSALLDALTWAVWGHARTPHGREEDLVYHGETVMSVEFTFRMPYQGGDERRFRILRRREWRGRRSVVSTLDLQVEGEVGWKILTAENIRTTQTRIVEHLGLDYETFINSAYLRQGHADEFTIQTSSERKRVLSAILGLDRWVEYQERAKRRLATAHGQAQEMERRLQEIAAELERRPLYEGQLQEAERLLDVAVERRRALEAQMQELTRVQEQARGLQQQVTELKQRLDQEAARRQQLRQDERAHHERLARYESLVAQAERIEREHEAYGAAVIAERAWGEKLGRVARLREEQTRHERAIAQAREALVAQLRALEQREARVERARANQRTLMEKQISDCRGQITTLEEQRPTPEMHAALAETQSEIAKLETVAQEQERTRQDIQENKLECTRLKARNDQVQKELTALKKRIADLDTIAADADCPVCRQPLTPEHRARLSAESQTERQGLSDEHRVNQERHATLEQAAKVLEQQMNDLERKLRRRSALEAQAAQMQQKIEQGEAAQRRVEVLRGQIAEIERHLNDNSYAERERQDLEQIASEKAAAQRDLEAAAYAAEARAALADCQAQLAAVDYDAAAHERLKVQLRELAHAEAEYRELEKARVGLLGEQEALKRLAGESAAQEERCMAAAAAHGERSQEWEALQPRLAELRRVAEQLPVVRREETQASQRLGAVQQNLAALQVQEKRRESLQEQRATLARRIGILTELRDAFGVNGIPAMMIEHTLPDLERETNRILQQLSGGRMHVRFETQRENKSGNLQETLDILIGDEKGSRPYENFSGGEQFRVNFAIRVALSRLLAKRSGVRLRTLFVDEGFGALDTEGRRRLVEAVKAVQDDFDMVLVITHIEELREVFPTHIQVAKTEAGSQVEVV